MTGQITVANKHTYKTIPGAHDVYIGRPTVFGNPYTHLPSKNTLAKYQVATRDEAVDAYKPWLLGLLNSDEFAWLSFVDLVQRYHSGEHVVLICYCSPERCHGDVLKDLVITTIEV